MGFTEKTCTGVIGTTLVVFGWYFYQAYTAMKAGLTAVDAFGPTLWWTLGLYVALLVIVMIITAVFSKDDLKEETDYDERDKQIEQRGEFASNYVAGFGLIGLLFLVMGEHNTFITAHAILAVIVLQTLVSFGVRLYLYRR